MPAYFIIVSMEVHTPSSEVSEPWDQTTWVQVMLLELCSSTAAEV